jgi:PKD domain
LSFALALLVAVAAWSAATASADQTGVSATIYPSSPGGVSHQSADAQALGGCPPYSSANPIYLYPPGQPDQLPATSWSLATVLTCGLRVPIGDVTGVQVLNPARGFETTLSNADVSDPTRYQDSQAPDALPVISVDGSQDQTTYTRPFRGTSDDNARDQVTQNGAPIALVVFANGPPLIVTASAQKLSTTAKATTIKLEATVQTPGGTPIPASALIWSWNFGDGTTPSAAVTPTHPYPGGSYFVTVQVTDTPMGTGGTATIQVTTPASPAPGKQNQSGGSKRTKSKSPNGPDKGGSAGHPGSGSRSKRPGSSDRSRSGSQPSDQSTNQTPTNTTASPSAPTTSATPSSTATTPSSTGTTPQSRPAVHAPPRASSPPRPKRSAPRRPTPPAASGPLVTGRLIADVTSQPVGSSPLVHVTPAGAAPAVRRATRSSSISAIGSALLVVVLLGLGAWHELRGRRRSVAVSCGH